MTIIKIILVFCLISFSLAAVFITPAYPPMAYQYQYYITVFRIRGADFPVFKFSGLPTGIVGASNGTVSGIPTVFGSFNVNLSYVSSGESGWKEFIMSVTADNLKRSSDSVISVRDSRSLVIMLPESLMYRTWQKMSIQFKARSGQQPYIWQYGTLPKGLIGNLKTGQITGVAREQGYYNINLKVADKLGKSASAYITINIQPQVKEESAKALVQLLLQNPQSRLDPEYVKFVQEYAAEDLEKAEIAVNEKRNVVTIDKKIADAATTKFDRANYTYFQSENEYSRANVNKKDWELLLAESQKIVNQAMRLFNLSSIERNSSILRFRQSQSGFNTANKRLSDAQKVIDSTQAMIFGSKAVYEKAQFTLKSATESLSKFTEDYIQIVQQLELKRQQQQDRKKSKQLLDLKVTYAKDSLQLDTQAKDVAEAQLNKMDFILDQDQSALELRIQKMTFTRSEYNKAKRDFDLQNLDFELKLNSLYLAQARKQSADRATAFALAEGSLSDHNSQNQLKTLGTLSNIGAQNPLMNSTIAFKGCDQENYPPMSGTSQVMRVSLAKKQLIITSGRSLIYGDCSSVQTVKIGDWIKFEGYLVRSVVNVVRVQKTSLVE